MFTPTTRINTILTNTLMACISRPIFVLCTFLIGGTMVSISPDSWGQSANGAARSANAQRAVADLRSAKEPKDLGTAWITAARTGIKDNGREDTLVKHTSGVVGICVAEGNSLGIRNANSVSKIKFSCNDLPDGDPGWEAIQIGDYDGDGDSDVIWQGPAGEVEISRIQKLKVISEDLVRGATTDRITHSVDLDGDGTTDLIWLSKDGRITAWTMKDGKSADTKPREIVKAGEGWAVVHAGLLDRKNAQGRGTIILRRPDGETALWRITGLEKIGGAGSKLSDEFIVRIIDGLPTVDVISKAAPVCGITATYLGPTGTEVPFSGAQPYAAAPLSTVVLRNTCDTLQSQTGYEWSLNGSSLSNGGYPYIVVLPAAPGAVVYYGSRATALGETTPFPQFVSFRLDGSAPAVPACTTLSATPPSLLPGAAIGLSLTGCTNSPNVYEWRQAGTLAAVTTTSTLTLPAPQAGGTYTYSGTARNGSGASTARTANVSVTANNAQPTVTINTPANNTVLFAPASPTVNVTAADTDGTINRVEFFRYGSILDTKTTAPYTSVLALSALAGVGQHTLTARAVDNQGGMTTSSPVQVFVSNPFLNVGFESPTVAVNTVQWSPSITNWTGSGTYGQASAGYLTGSGRPTPQQGTQAAVISHANGTLAQTVYLTQGRYSVAFKAMSENAGGMVKLSQGATVLGTSSVSVNAWTPINIVNFQITTGGNYTFTIASSTPAVSGNLYVDDVVISAYVNASPTVSLSLSPTGPNYPALPNITLGATATDVGGSIASVEFLVGTFSLGTVTTPPYTLTWNAVNAGTYTVSAKATDNEGASATSSTTITVAGAANQAPAVSFTTPTNNQVFTDPVSIPITISATDADGVIRRVDVFRDGVLIKTFTTAPYTWTWPSVYPGTYVLTAVAYDNVGVSTTSSPITVTVNASATTFANPSFESPVTTGAPVSGVTIPGWQGIGDYSLANNTWLTSTAGWAATSIGTQAARVAGSNGALKQTIFLQAGTYTLRYRYMATASFLNILVKHNGVAISTPQSPSLNGGVSNWVDVATTVYAATTGNQEFVFTVGAPGTTAEVFFDDIRLTLGSTITVPTASLTAGAYNAQAPTAVLLAASVVDPSVVVERVEFYNGTTFLGQILTTGNPPMGNSSPRIYEFMTTVLPAGTYNFIAKPVYFSTARVNSNTVTMVLTTIAPQTKPFDLNGDGKSDIVFRNDQTGEVFLHTLNGLSVGPISASITTLSDLNWRVVASGDFNGDGKADLLMQHAVTADATMYLMNGNTVLSSTVVYGGQNGSWRVVAAADFNNDGKADILYYNTQTFEVYVGLMNGTAVINHGSLGSPGTADWKIVAVADMDGDGKADIVWRHVTTGDVYVWRINGTTGLPGIGLGTVADLDWKIVGAADFNGDGSTDLLWHHNTTGLVFIWFLNNGTFSSAAGVTTVSDLNWRIVGTGDYNGDGKADILFRHAVTGEVFVYLMNGATITSAGAVFTQPNLAWKVVGSNQGSAMLINQPPLVSLTAPTNGAGFAPGSNITISAIAADPDGLVTKVEFLNGNTKIGEALTAPYNFVWSNVPAGTYSLRARAIDNGSPAATATSNAVSIVVANGANQPVSVVLDLPTTNASFVAPASVALQATTTDLGQRVAKVEFYRTDTSATVATVTTGGAGHTPATSRYAAVWSNAPAGNVSIAARAKDIADNVIATTSAAAITISATAPVEAAALKPVDKLTLPHTGRPDAGSLPGALTVSKDGAANYSIDIAVPPGTAGVQPKLSLNYSSQGTNGLVGVGWSLSGLSSIHRCGKTIAQDGINERIAFGTSDRLCLDGQRLVLVNLPASDANYWADNAEYRTEIDSFTRVRAQGTGVVNRSFLVESKDGRIMRYGDVAISANSAVKVVLATYPNQAGVAPTAPLPANKPGALSWSISEVRDRSDNYMRYEYEQDLTTGEHRPKRIRYGGKGLPAHAAVVFDYTPRDDAWTKYVDEVRNDLRSKLSKVTTFIGNVDTAAGTPVRIYKLDYDVSKTSGRSLLISVTPCATNPQTGQEECLPKTTFDWGQPADNNKKPRFVSKGLWNNAPNMTLSVPSTFLGQGFMARTHHEYFAFSDFNKDGRMDILEKRVSSPSQVSGSWDADVNPTLPGKYFPQYRYFHNNGAGFTAYNYRLDTMQSFVVLSTGDFNGDGFPDLLVETEEISGTTRTIQVKVCVFPSATGVPASTNTQIVFVCGSPISNSGVGNIQNTVPFPIDLHGNGLTSFYSPYNEGGLSGLTGANLCTVQTPTSVVTNAAPTITCTLRQDAPQEILSKLEQVDSYPKVSLHGFTSFVEMIDFAGTGKPSDVRWTEARVTQNIDDGGARVGLRYWINLTPRVLVTDFKVPGGNAVTTGAIASYGYTAYPSPAVAQIGGPPTTGEQGSRPYEFIKGGSADFNGSGYSSTAYGFGELRTVGTGANAIREYNPARLEFTVCLSTGRSLDCRVRKKLSGSEFRFIHAIGQFEGDGQPTIVTQKAVFPPGGGIADPRGGVMEFCRITGDDASNGTSVTDANVICREADIDEFLFNPRTLPANASGGGDYKVLGDFLGTGRTQVMYYYGGYVQNGMVVNDGRWELFEAVDLAQPTQALDRIHRVTNGVGHVSSVEYVDGLVTGTVTRSGTDTLTYPRHTLAATGKIVSKLRVNAGGSAERSTTYRYQDQAIDLSGRGSLGFAKVITTDDQTGIETTTTHSQAWPFTGMALSTVTKRNATSMVTLSSTTNTLTTKSISQANGTTTQFPYVASSSTTRNDLNGSALGSEIMAGVDTNGADTTDVQYDNWGNMIGSRVEVTGVAEGQNAPIPVFKTKTQNTFVPVSTIVSGSDTNLTYWLVGLLQSTKVTKTESITNTSIAREKSFEYSTDGKGRLTKEIVEPAGSNDLKLTTEYTYLDANNVFGLPATKTVKWIDLQSGSPQSATETTTYDANGRYPFEIFNARNHKETRGYSARDGVMTSLTGPNLLTTSWTLDGFGRVIEELRADGTSTKTYRKQCQAQCGVTNAVVVEMQDTFSSTNGTNRITVPTLAYSNVLGQALRSHTWGFDGREIYVDKRYDARGRLIEEDQPRFAGEAGILAKTTAYDDLDRVTETKVFDDDAPSAGRLTKTEYNGFVHTHTNPKSQVRVDRRDALGRIQKVTDALNGVTQFTYDAFGNLTKTIDPNGNVISVDYDTLGHKTALTDPNLGLVKYWTDARGLLWKQQSPNQRIASPAQFSRMEYDVLGRMTGRYEPDLESHWVYDTAVSGKGIGQLAEAYTGTSSNKLYRRTHSYDSLGRPATTSTIPFVGEVAHTQTTDYDVWGRTLKQTHQRGTDPAKVFDLRYNDWGYAYQWQRGALVLSRTLEHNAAQQVTVSVLGNGLVEKSTFDTRANRLKAQRVETLATALRISEAYTFDEIGNVSQRKQDWDSAPIPAPPAATTPTTFTENFTYDALNRISTSQVVGQGLLNFEYDATGNLTRKTGVGSGLSNSIQYPTGPNATRPHAVSTITGAAGTFGTGSYMYDNNGNLTAANGRSATWTSFDMPAILSKAVNGGVTSATFTYGPEHQRVKQVRGDGVTTITVTYAGAQEIETNTSANPQTRTIKTYWPGGLGVEIDRAVPINASPNNALSELNWTHTDRLGSPMAMSAADGTLRERMAYDTWGKRRTLDGANLDNTPQGSTPTPDSIDGQTDNRGFTGHEMLDALDLVHMNGRIYDPLIGRFVSADPILQDPMNGQSYNRYSYVMNNPTNLTDPTGFVAVDGGACGGGKGMSLCGFLDGVFSSTVGFATAFWQSLTPQQQQAYITTAGHQFGGDG
jgi:RHS repeat-associated protein